MIQNKSSWLIGVMLVAGLVSFSCVQAKEKMIAEETSYAVDSKATAGKKVPVKTVVIAEETMWSPNYKEESVEVVATKFGKQFNKKVVVSPNVKGKKINVALTKATFDDVLKALTLPQGWEYIQDGDKISIMTRDEYQAEMKQRIATKIYLIKYVNVETVSSSIQSALSSWGNWRIDKLNNQIIITDSPDVLAAIEKYIANLDIPIKTLRIPIQYRNLDNVMQIIAALKSNRGIITGDKKTNQIIIQDIQPNLEQIQKMIAELENDAKSIPQVNIDCSIIKVALNQKYMAGIDWTTCPFTAKEISAKTGVYLKNIDPNKLIDWLKIFGEPDLISRKKATVVPGNQVSVREGAQYQIVVNLTPADTTKPMMSTRNTVDSGFTYTFNVQPSIDEKEKIIQLTYKVDGVLPEKGNRITYSVSVDNARIKDGYTLVTEDIRRLPLATTVSGIVLEESQSLKYGSIDLILLITPSILQP